MKDEVPVGDELPLCAFTWRSSGAIPTQSKNEKNTIGKVNEVIPFSQYTLCMRVGAPTMQESTTSMLHNQAAKAGILKGKKRLAR